MGDSWIQQNHDGLPQKAGFPQDKINEVHGSWYNPANPVVKYTGSLKDDEEEWMTKALVAHPELVWALRALWALRSLKLSMRQSLASLALAWASSCALMALSPMAAWVAH